MGKQREDRGSEWGNAALGAAAWAAIATAAMGQGPTPFQAPVALAADSRSAIAAVAECNRDGSPDVLALGQDPQSNGTTVPVGGGVAMPGTLVTSLDERGHALAANVVGPLLPVLPDDNTPGAAALVAGDLNGDGRDDLVVVGIDGVITWRTNRGATTLGGTDFGPDASLDDLAWLAETTPPHAWYRLPAARALDADGDGDQDVLLAGTVHERGTDTALASFAMLFRNLGNGGFVSVRRKFAGNVVDAAFADFDRDGDFEQLVVLVEVGAAGAFANEVRHFSFGGSSLLQVGSSIPLGPGRATALALADVDGDHQMDYVVAQNVWSGGRTNGGIAWYGGNGQGQLLVGAWGAIPLPGNGSGLGDPIVALLAGDWNQDGFDDLAAVRAFVSVTMNATAFLPSTAPSELLVACGPGLPYAPSTALPLPGTHDALSLALPPAFQRPLDLLPGLLRPLDLKRDGAPDLLVLALDAATSGGSMAVIANDAPLALGAPRLDALGEGTGGAPLHAARLGFDGGAPRIGNGGFRCTLQNVQGGCLAGLIWGWFGYADLFPVNGFMMHLMPSEFGVASLTSGTAAGEGFATFALPIPNDPALVGEFGAFQYVYYDHVAGAFGGSQGASLWIGQ
jgi:hypothetical protein